MRIVEITISSDFLMSEEWGAMYDKALPIVESLAEWTHQSDGSLLSFPLCGEARITEVCEVLSSFPIPFEAKEVRGAYNLYRTNAPESYDGFGTFTVVQNASSGDFSKSLANLAPRIVAILSRHSTWQIGRYQSGLYACTMETHEPIK